MKTFTKKMWAFGMVAFLAFSLLGSQAAQARPGNRISFQTFYDELSPYGEWINDAEYGYVWSPRVERSFQPYATRGHWVMTEYGNTWVSDYEWGWAPFHYGRWIYDDFEGWLWIPDTVWGPAWVDWRHSSGYYGWAPMGPRVTYIVPATRWIFVPVMYIVSPRVYSYCVPRTRVVNIYHNTTIINNYYERDNRRYVYGPRNQEIERATNRRVNVYRVDNDSRPGRNVVADNSVRIYRPEIDSRRQEAPTRVEARNRTANRSSFTDGNDSAGKTDRTNTTGRTRASRNAAADVTRNSTAEPRSDYNQDRSERVRATERNTGGTRERSSSTTNNPLLENRAARSTERTEASPRSREAGMQNAPRMREVIPATRQRQLPASSPATVEPQNVERRREVSRPAAPTQSRTQSVERQEPPTRTRQTAAPAPATPRQQSTAPVREGGRRSRE